MATITIMKLKNAKQISKSRELGVLLNSTLTQRRILYSCLAVMNPVVPHLAGMKYAELKEWMLDNAREAHKLRTYYLDIRDFSGVWGLSKSKDVKGMLLDAIGYDEASGTSKIMHLCFKYKALNTNNLEFINVFSRVKIEPETASLMIRFTDDILPYLINLASYTAIPFKATVGFKCNYSFAMLEYLLQRYVRGSDYPTHTLSLEALQMTLGTNKQKSYERWHNFQTRVLEPIAQDFSNIAGGGYELTFTPIYAKGTMRGRRKVESVEIAFSNIGVQKFLTEKEAQITNHNKKRKEVVA